MLQIGCPWCGVRDEDEFRCGGEIGVPRPGPGVDDAGWCNYMFSRANVKGPHLERWLHAYGCGRWFEVKRDTLNHAMETLTRADLAPPRSGTQR